MDLGTTAIGRSTRWSMVYSPQCPTYAVLDCQITRLEEISPGSEEELEIRGCSVEAVERMREAIAAKFRGA